MKYDVVEKKLFLQRTPEEKQPILARLSRIEGQVRGLRQMVETDRYCGEELQQAAAITAALREVTLLVLHDHLEAGIEHACEVRSQGQEEHGSRIAVAEMSKLLRSALRH